MWNSVNLPKSAFTGMTWDNVFQMKFDGQFNADGSANTAGWDVYVDNIYFYRTPLPTSINITFNLDMSDVEVDPSGVYVAGGSQFGAPGENQLLDEDGDGIYSGVVSFPEAPDGAFSDYTFTNGNCSDGVVKRNSWPRMCVSPAQ